MPNPIIHRELLGTLRTKRALAIQVTLAAVLAALVLLRWPVEGRVDVIDTMRAKEVLGVFGYGLLAGVILLAPVFPATSVVKEKQQGSLALLLNSPMSPWSIAAGKLGASLGFLALLLALSAPAAAACFAMGGIAPGRQLGAMYLVLAALAVQYSTLGLLISTYANSTDSALRLTYGAVLLLAVFAMGPYQFLGTTVEGAPAEALAWLTSLSPIPPMAEAMGHEAMLTGGLEQGGNVLRFLALALGTSAVFFVGTALRLNQRIFDRSRDAGRTTDELSGRAQAYRRVMYLWFFDPQRRSELIGLRPAPTLLALVLALVSGAAATAWFMMIDIEGDVITLLGRVIVGVIPGFIAIAALVGAFLLVLNGVPTAVKEQKTNRFGRSHWMMRLIGGCLILSLLLALGTTVQTETWGAEALGGVMVLMQVSLIILVTPTLASGVISSERESGGWELLHMTPMSATGIILGKLLSVTWTMSLLLLATLPGYLVLMAIDTGQQLVIATVLVSLVLTAAMAVLVSAAISSLFARTAPATVTAYTFLAILCAGTFLFWLGEDAPFTHQAVERALMFNPLAAALNLIQAPGFRHYNLVPGTWWFMIGLCLLSIVVLVVRTWQLIRPR